MQGNASPLFPNFQCFYEKSVIGLFAIPLSNLDLFKTLSLPLAFLYDVQDVGSELILFLWEFTKL